MKLKDLLSLCGRVGLTVAAFALVASIIAGPLLQKVWSSRVAMSEQLDKSNVAPPIPPVELKTKKQG